MFLFSAPWRFFSLNCCFFGSLQDFGDPRLANQASLVALPQEQQHVSVVSTMEIFFIEVLLLQHPPGFRWSTAGQSSFLSRSSTGTAACFCSQHHGDFFHWIVASSAISRISVIQGWPIKFPFDADPPVLKLVTYHEILFPVDTGSYPLSLTCEHNDLCAPVTDLMSISTVKVQCLPFQFIWVTWNKIKQNEIISIILYLLYYIYTLYILHYIYALKYIIFFIIYSNLLLLNIQMSYVILLYPWLFIYFCVCNFFGGIWWSLLTFKCIYIYMQMKWLTSARILYNWIMYLHIVIHISYVFLMKCMLVYCLWSSENTGIHGTK